MVQPLDLHLVNVASIPTGPTHGEGRLQPHPGDVLKSTPNVRKSARSGLKRYPNIAERSPNFPFKKRVYLLRDPHIESLPAVFSGFLGHRLAPHHMKLSKQNSSLYHCLPFWRHPFNIKPLQQQQYRRYIKRSFIKGLAFSNNQFGWSYPFVCVVPVVCEIITTYLKKSSLFSQSSL